MFEAPFEVDKNAFSASFVVFEKMLRQPWKVLQFLF